MEWFSILLLIVMGLALLIVELIFIPGTTIIGLLGLIFIIAGVYFGFESYDKTTGLYILGGTLVLTVLTLYFGFKSKAWEQFSLKTAVQGKFNEGLSDALSLGDEGIATSTLKPVGKAEINSVQYEVTSMGGYLDTGKKIKVIKIDRNKIVVEPIN
jgi:membrane-bound ClpP family serine protease